MGNNSNAVNKDYRPPPGGVPQSQISYSQTGKVLVPPNRQSNSPRAQRQQSKPQIKMMSPRQKPNPSTNPQQSNINQSNISAGKEAQRSQTAEVRPQQSEKNIMVSQSSIKLVETSMMRSQLMVSALRVEGFQGEEFKGRKVKKFNIEANVPEKDLIKESNYFDESQGDLGVRPKVAARMADFSVGSFEQINTFPVRTYLFDRALNDRLVA